MRLSLSLPDVVDVANIANVAYDEGEDTVNAPRDC
jgi:hypothetical protein